MLDCPAAHRPAELGDEQDSFVDIWPDFQIGGDSLTGLVVERDALDLIAFAPYLGAPYIIRVLDDTPRQLDIVYGEVS